MSSVDPAHPVASEGVSRHDTSEDDGRLHVHAVPPRVLLSVFAALLVFTVLTVAVTYVDLGRANVWIALLIAVAKAGLVAMYFMHLRYEHPFNGIILITSLLFVALFIGAALQDSGQYQPNLEPPPGMVGKP